MSALERILSVFKGELRWHGHCSLCLCVLRKKCPQTHLDCLRQRLIVSWHAQTFLFVFLLASEKQSLGILTCPGFPLWVMSALTFFPSSSLDVNFHFLHLKGPQSQKMSPVWMQTTTSHLTPGPLILQEHQSLLNGVGLQTGCPVQSTGDCVCLLVGKPLHWSGC